MASQEACAPRHAFLSRLSVAPLLSRFSVSPATDSPLGDNPAMNLTSLTAISPLDGRYRSKVAALAGFASEFGLIRCRVRVEVAWLKALAAEPALGEIGPFSPE